jgi:TrmH family RNA methyltransferase
MDAGPEWFNELRSQVRQRQDPWVILEGRQAVEAAVAGWWDVAGILADDGCDWEPPDWSGLEVLRRPIEVIVEQLGGAALQGVMGLAKQPDETADVAGLMAELEDDAMVVVCPCISEEEYAGAIIRNAAALGAKAVIFGKEGVSPFDRISVQASAGAIFRTPVRVADGGQILRCLKMAGFQLIGGTSGDESVSLSRVELDAGRLALVIGSADGRLGSFWEAACDSLAHVRSDSSGEALDPVAVCSVFLWELTRRIEAQADQDLS